jgi:5-methylcytosine-specific restriction enzyme A
MHEQAVNYVFEALGKSRGIRYKGSFACASWEKRARPDKRGNTRQVIVFHLVLTEDISEEVSPTPNATLDELRRMAYDASRDVAERSTREARQSYYKRSAAVKAYVLARAAGSGTC